MPELKATQALLDVVAAGLNAANQPLGSGNTFHIELSKTVFGENNGSGFTEADFDGYAAKTCTAFANGVDVYTGKRTFTLLPPTGGPRFVAGENISGAQSIHGYRVRDTVRDYVVGHKLLDAPLVIVNAGQQLNLPEPIQLVLRDDAM